MKPIFIPAVLALTTIVLAPLAQAENYVGLSIGRSKQEFNSNLKLDDTEASWKLYGGYNFTRNFGFEAGYVAHGSADERWPEGWMRSKGRSTYVAGTATLHLSEQFSLTGKLGVADNRTKFIYSAYGYTGTFANTHGMAGVGVSWKLAPSLSAVAEYEHFGKLYRGYGGQNIKASSLSIGVRKSF